MPAGATPAAPSGRLGRFLRQDQAGHVKGLRGRRAADPDGVEGRTIEAIRAAFERAGVEFTNGDGPGVRLRKAKRKAK
jgi:hypothetical protein